jgi:hypothetical protein
MLTAATNASRPQKRFRRFDPTSLCGIAFPSAHSQSGSVS